ESNFGKYEWFNKNRLISNYKYATGGKIGYTKRASHTFVSSATKDGKNLVIASFVDPDRFDTHEAMYEKYFDMYKKYTVIDRNNLNIDYKDGYRVHTKESFSILLTNAEKKKIERKVELYEDVKGTKGEQVIGTIAVVLDGEVLEKMNIYAEIPNIPKKRTFFEKLKEFFGW
ncbi:MAG TPA: hypothetical protein DCY94_00615, partial [Firmicutes bacterium]|nr:hypothetical protein [Bacillota bacterium]